MQDKGVSFTVGQNQETDKLRAHKLAQFQKRMAYNPIIESSKSVAGRKVADAAKPTIETASRGKIVAERVAQ